MKVRAKFAVTKVAEMGYDGKRSEITRVKKHVKANTPDLDDASVSENDRTITRYVSTEYESTGVPVREVTMSAVFRSAAIVALAKLMFSPSGTLTFTIDNEALAEEFKPGDVYYLDFEKVS